MDVYFSPKALRSLSRIYRYIAVENHSPENAEKLIADIEQQTVNQLSDMPFIGRQVASDKNIRFIVVRNHTVVYKVHKQQITVADIFGAGRNWRR